MFGDPLASKYLASQIFAAIPCFSFLSHHAHQLTSLLSFSTIILTNTTSLTVNTRIPHH